MNRNYLEIYHQWCHDAVFDQATRDELINIKDPDEIKDRFYRDLSFGTGGLRGVIGAGTNRMNIYTVTKATQGIANYILKNNGQEKGVAIAYDSRHMSPEFSEAAALCLNANGIKTYRFDSLRPTPELSFAVRKLGCIAGIVITASHNPKEYNGYKVYWEDGAQITAPRDKEIIAEVNAVTAFSSIKMLSRREAVKTGLFHIIGDEIDRSYLDELKKLVLSPEHIQSAASELSIVYTPLHGSGNLLSRKILEELGFQHVYIVPEQELPDGDFPTVPYPNPEDKKAFDLALKLAEQKKADLVLATDPDADRLGVYARDSQSGSYIPFTGNMSGILIAEYQLSRKKELGLLPEPSANGALVKTIVTTNMADVLAKEYGITLIEVLTGFKYIGEQIKFFEKNKKENGGVLSANHKAYEYLFGFEESYGCLTGTYARDKDAVSTLMILCESAAYYKLKGLSLWDQMVSLYERYGFFMEDQVAITLKGADGADQINAIMQSLREKTPSHIGDYKVLKVRDYQSGKLNLPLSNVLYFDLENNGWCCARPSGTEPKIKFYMGIKGENLTDAQNALNKLKKALTDLVSP